MVRARTETPVRMFWVILVPTESLEDGVRIDQHRFGGDVVLQLPKGLRLPRLQFSKETDRNPSVRRRAWRGRAANRMDEVRFAGRIRSRHRRPIVRTSTPLCT